ncbi:MAG TPA: hypothetical protein VHA73_13980 [Acidimicrobiales bacterium]|nr:hypothetical protein [Acidimicrobiales bacterium]
MKWNAGKRLSGAFALKRRIQALLGDADATSDWSDGDKAAEVVRQIPPAEVVDHLRGRAVVPAVGSTAMKRALVILCLAVAVAGCSSSGGKAGNTTASSSTAASSDSSGSSLSDRLLRLSDMPTGWVEDTAPTASSCVNDGLKGIAGREAKAYVSFGDPSGFPTMSEDVSRYTNPSGAMADIKALMAKCTSFTTKADGASAKWTIKPASFPTIGDESAAFSATIDIEQDGEQLTAGGYVVVTQRDGLTATVFSVDYTPDADQAQDFATKAAQRMAG